MQFTERQARQAVLAALEFKGIEVPPEVLEQLVKQAVEKLISEGCELIREQ